MKTLEQVLEAANVSYDEEIKKNPQINKEEGRASFVLGYLKSAYERLFDEYTAIRLS